MRLITRIGSFDIAQKSGDDLLTVRARRKEHLEALRDTYLPAIRDIAETPQADYPFRVRVSREHLCAAVYLMAWNIDYDNF